MTLLLRPAISHCGPSRESLRRNGAGQRGKRADSLVPRDFLRRRGRGRSPAAALVMLQRRRDPAEGGLVPGTLIIGDRELRPCVSKSNGRDGLPKRAARAQEGDAAQPHQQHAKP